MKPPRQRNHREVSELLFDLKQCINTKDLDRGKKIHENAANSGHDSCVYIASSLVHMYAKCGRMAEARQVFDGMQNPNVVSWTALILGYAENRQGKTALDLFAKMRAQGCVPNSVTYVAAVKACTSMLDQDGNRRDECLTHGKLIHSQVSCRWEETHVHNTLIDMYSKCGSMIDARQVFDKMTNRNVVSWNAIILGYAGNGEGKLALDLFTSMQSQGCEPNRTTYVAALKACISLVEKYGSDKCLDLGRKIHSEITCLEDLFVQNTLIDMYAKCHSMAGARQVFDGVKEPNLVLWNTIILGYAENGNGVAALSMFARMLLEGNVPDSGTFLGALKGCSSVAEDSDEIQKNKCKTLGAEIHSEIGCNLNTSVENTLIHMYAKSGSMPEASKVFDNMDCPTLVSWNALILGYGENGDGNTALHLFARMKHEGYEPDSITFVGALKACGSNAQDQDENEKTESLNLGRQLHSEASHLMNSFVQSSLIDMYANCGSLGDAQMVFDSIRQPDLVAWNALILGCAENGETGKAFELYEQMKSHGCRANHVTFFAALKACASLGAVQSGIKIHAEIENGGHCNAMLVTSLVDFYAKCGSLDCAQEVFDTYSSLRGLGSWTALLAGYSRVGDHKAALELFERMQDAGFQPNSVTFLCILACCSHAGLVEKADNLFEIMCTIYGVIPTIEHYTCMVDILGRSNKIEDAMALLRSIPCRTDAVTWTTVLCACRKWKHVGIGRLAFKSLVTLTDKRNATAYVLMSQIYGGRGMWEEILQMRKYFQLSTTQEWR